jgi:cyanophycinase
MFRLRLSGFMLACAGLAPALHAQAPPPAYRYFRVGNTAQATVTLRAGYALMGGGKDLDEAFQWLCGRAPGGDLLVLRASGDDDYNPYIKGLCKLNSVATLILPNRAAAMDPFAAQAIRDASVLFIAGGDQANYINFWQGTPVQDALNGAIRRGVPIGGTSAGLAVLGEYAYTAQGDRPDDKDLDSRTAIANPFGPRITLVHRFLNISILDGIITDSHFAKRNRMGRLLVFIARLNAPRGSPQLMPSPPVRGLGIDEGAAVLVEPDGAARVIGRGRGAWFVSETTPPQFPDSGRPMASGQFDVQRVTPGHAFNLRTWTGDASRFTLSIEAEMVHSTQPGGEVY